MMRLSAIHMFWNIWDWMMRSSDVSLTPNRSDCMAAFAMAKETGAVLDRKVTLPAYEGAYASAVRRQT